MTPFGDSGLLVTRLGLGLAALGRPGYINLGHSVDLGGDLDVGADGGSGLRGPRPRVVAGRPLFRCRAVVWPGRGVLIVLAGVEGCRAGVGGGRIEVGIYLHRRMEERGRPPRGQRTTRSPRSVARPSRETRATLGPQPRALPDPFGDPGKRPCSTTGPVREELARLRAEWGWRVGLSLTGPRQGETLRKALEVEVDGHLLFDAVQATWNLLETSACPALAEASASGLGVIVKEGLANGRLTARNVEPEFLASKAILRDEADPARDLDRCSRTRSRPIPTPGPTSS